MKQRSLPPFLGAANEHLFAQLDLNFDSANAVNHVAPQTQIAVLANGVTKPQDFVQINSSLAALANNVSTFLDRNASTFVAVNFVDTPTKEMF